LYTLRTGSQSDRDLISEPIEIAQVGNASIQKASGPSSKLGKERSSRNAIKHGILSDVVVLPGESHDRYQALLQELNEALAPEGRLEELLVEKLATLSWRQRRLLAAEGAEIREGSEFLEWDKQNRERQKEANRICALDVEHMFGRDIGLIWKIQDPEVLTSCLELLGELRQEIESSGFDKRQDTAVLEKIYGPVTESGKTLFQTYVFWLGTSNLSDDGRQKEGYETPEQCKDKVLAEVDKEVRRLRGYQRKRTSIESERAKLEALRRSVPEPERLDRLLRYEASLERAFDRTLNQLERMQRLRRGQPVAPRIDVNVSS
jgi:hypothetical protein